MPRRAAAAADVVESIRVMDPRQSGPWYFGLTQPGLFYAFPLVLVWLGSQF